MVSIKKYLSRTVHFVLKGESKVFVRVDNIVKVNLFKGKNIIITGASSGMGYETTSSCLLDGCNLLCMEERLKLLRLLERIKSDIIHYMQYTC